MRSYQHKYTNAQLDFKLTYGDKNETQLTFLIYIYSSVPHQCSADARMEVRLYSHPK